MNAPAVQKLKLASISRPAPDWLRDLVMARAYYEERFGWPVAVQVAERQLSVALGTVVDAITMPAGLAAQVHAQLGIALLAGPVIGHTDGGRWTFLTQPVEPSCTEFADGLVEHDLQYAGGGAYTVIPASNDDRAGWRWISAPQPNQAPPSPYAVVATVRRVCATARAA
jgi:hypothetical protein